LGEKWVCMGGKSQLSISPSPIYNPCPSQSAISFLEKKEWDRRSKERYMKFLKTTRNSLPKKDISDGGKSGPSSSLSHQRQG